MPQASMSTCEQSANPREAEMESGEVQREVKKADFSLAHARGLVESQQETFVEQVPAKEQHNSGLQRKFRRCGHRKFVA